MPVSTRPAHQIDTLADTVDDVRQSRTDLTLLPIFTGIFVSVLVLSTPLASKFVAIGPFNVAGATLIFPISYIFNDIFTEVYGFSKSRRIIWIGMGCQIFSAFLFWLVGVLPAAPFWHNQAAYDTILGAAPRITLASFLAYFCGEFANSLVMSKMKYSQHGARGFSQGCRFVASTVVGEAVDTAVFFTLAFYGAMANSDLFSVICTIYIAKVLYEILALPVSTRLANWVKRVEGIDKIDDPHRTDYNPFALLSRELPEGSRAR